jgi:hypothetical protein
LIIYEVLGIAKWKYAYYSIAHDGQKRGKIFI